MTRFSSPKWPFILTLLIPVAIAALIAGATLLGAALEIVYLVDDLNGTVWYRMNTVFKFYNQIWNLLGIACGVIVGIVIWRLLVWEEPIDRKCCAILSGVR